jgi:hypothetical protein
MTPGGKISAISLHSSKVESDAFSSGFKTTVLPAATAGAILNEAMMAGTFHGMIWPHTPYGSRFATRYPSGMGRPNPSCVMTAAAKYRYWETAMV